MRKSGFTLVELLGVIVVLAIISTIAVSVYTTVFDKQKETAFENKAELIELSAVKWATELNISKSTTITVAKLVNDSYYQADDVKDDEAIVNDPRDNSSLLCNTISITIDNGSPVATLNEEQDCELKEVEIDSSKVRILAYEYNDGKVIKNIKSIDDTTPELPWTSKSVLLVVEPEEEYSNYTKVTFSNGDLNEEKLVSGNNIIKSSDITDGQELNPASYANAYLVETNLFLVTDYSVSLNVVDVGVKNNYVTVKIDKEAPSVTVSMNNAWTSEEKIVTLKGTDGTGSGLKGFYVSTSETDYLTDSEFVESSYEANITKGTGDFYAFAVDNVDNVSSIGKKFNVANIDMIAPSCSISIVKESEFKTDPNSEWYTKDVTIQFTTSVAGGTGLSYGYGYELEESYSTGTLQEGQSKTITTVLNEDKIHHYYGYVQNALGKTSKCSIEVKVDRTKPKLSYINSYVGLRFYQNYNTLNNIKKSYGPSGERSISCDPANNSTVSASIQTVTCTAISENGESSSISYLIKHQYPATYVRQTCGREECGEEEVRHDSWCKTGGYGDDVTFGSGGCGGYYSYSMEWVCHWRSYDCSYYSCPQGGSPIGATCYY